MKWKRLFYYIFINILVSTITVLVVLTLWDRSHNTEPPESVNVTPVIAIPTLTPTISIPEPEITLRAYQVAPGETLGEIALAFDITVEELLTLNGLTDPDTIGAGTTIFVPEEKVLSDPLVPTDEGAPSSMTTGQVEIAGIFGAGDLSSERVQLRGLGEGTLILTGWILMDEDGNVFTLPIITLFGNGAVDIYSAAGVDTVVALYWNSGQAVWDSGETATLRDREGNIQATYTLP